MFTLSDWEGGPLVVKPKVAWKMLACSNTRGYQLLAAGEIISFLDGRNRKILVASIRDYIERQLAVAKSPIAQAPAQQLTGHRSEVARVRSGPLPRDKRDPAAGGYGDGDGAEDCQPPSSRIHRPKIESSVQHHLAEHPPGISKWHFDSCP